MRLTHQIVAWCCVWGLSAGAVLAQDPVRRLPATELPMLDFEQTDFEQTGAVRAATFADDDSGRAAPVAFVRQPSVGAELGFQMDGVDFNPPSSMTQSFDIDSGSESPRMDVGADFYSAPDFEGGILVIGRDAALKIGGFVSANLIYDLDAIDSTDSFDTSTIPTDGQHRTNTRFQARQTRLSFDTRWRPRDEIVRMYIEGDFFSPNNGSNFRLRHAYGEINQILVGRTWTTFTDVGAAPATLDFEGSVSNVNRRQAQIRWTTPVVEDRVIVAVALEDPRNIIIAPEVIEGDSRTPTPDLIARVRFQHEFLNVQVAGVYRELGFQPVGLPVLTADAWGFNFTGVLRLAENNKAYYQILFGEGIGSYRDLPDAAPTLDSKELLGLFGWMVGVTHEWSDALSSNFTYAENKLNNSPAQQITDLNRTTYLAANLIWTPYERVNAGVEYLYGLRQDISGDIGTAHRVQFGVTFFLP